MLKIFIYRHFFMEVQNYNLVYSEFCTKPHFKLHLNLLHLMWLIKTTISVEACSLPWNWFTVYKSPPDDEIKLLVIYILETLSTVMIILVHIWHSNTSSNCWKIHNTPVTKNNWQNFLDVSASERLNIHGLHMLFWNNGIYFEI